MALFEDTVMELWNDSDTKHANMTMESDGSATAREMQLGFDTVKSFLLQDLLSGRVFAF